MSNELWAGMRIPIIMVSAEVNNGKTLFALTIDPNCRRPAAEVKATTIAWDQEGSADTYEGGLNFIHKDTRAAIAAGVHMQTVAAGPNDPRWRKMLLETADVNDSPSASLFRAWYISLLNTEPGVYRVGICDTFTPLQSGLADWLRKHPAAFGRSAAEYEKFAQATLWPDLKEVLAYILATDCRLRFETFVMTCHLKNEWKNKAPTGKRTAEGIDVMEKLATLHLELDRTPKEKDKEAPRVPSALVKKERLVRFGANSDGDNPILPPRIAKCTPDEIRRYIGSPPDFAKLRPEERLPDQSMSDDERLRINAAIAENNRAAEESKVSALEMARRAMEQGRAFVQSAPATATIQATGAPVGNEPVSSVKTDAAGPVVCDSPITEQQCKEMLSVMKQLFTTGKDAMGWIQSNYQASDPGRLTTDQAADAIIRLTKDLADKKLAATKVRDGARQINVFLHRLIMEAMPNEFVDHVHGNTFDNRRCELRRCTRKENCRNARAVGGTSRFKGVSLHARSGKWRAQICRDGRNMLVGMFATETEAAKAYNVAAVRFHGQFARLNEVA